MKPTLAIIGTGIAGMGAAYRLRAQYDLTIYEKNNYVGGHTNTVYCDDDGRPLPVDTGFIVYNETTYPNLTQLFAELRVTTQPSDMSFGVHNRNVGLEWAGHSLNGIFAQRGNLLRPKFWRLLREAGRFNRTAVSDLVAGHADCSLGDYLERQGYDSFFRENYIVPMGSAVWSTPLDKMLHFPASALIRFFQNHGFLGYRGQLAWRTVTGGAQKYMQAIVAAVGAERVRRGAPVRAVIPEDGGARVHTDHSHEYYDRVLVATHADEALSILAAPTELQSRLLTPFQYERNQAVLHTDESVMGPTRRAWASWNYKIQGHGDERRTAVIYYMNRLQGLETNRHYFVSLNDSEQIREEHVIRVIDYMHPLFDRAAQSTQPQLAELNRGGPIYFAGSYFRHGFHEDALWSGIQAAEALRNARLVSV